MNTSVLRVPDRQVLPQYLDALHKGWTPEADCDSELALAAIQRVEHDPDAFLSSLRNPGAKGPPITLDSGLQVPRLATMRYWIYDGSYCGDLNLRWQPGTSELPDYCDGHVGYSVVPWKRRYGLASAALIELSRIVPTLGLKWLDIAMGIDNTASRQVALSAGGKFSQEYVASEQGGVLACRYRIACVDA